MSEFDIHKVRRLDGSLLLVFHELIKCRNAKEVATRLHLSQSAVSHSLSRLRDLFADQLFVRRPHGLEPTKRTLELQSQVEHLLHSTEALLDIRREFDPINATRLFSVSIPEYATPILAAPLIVKWRTEAPSLFLFYKHLREEESISDLRRGELDLAVGRFENGLPSDMRKELLYEDEFCVVARRKHPRIRGTLTNKRYVSEHHVLAHDRSEVTPSESRTYPKMPSGVIVGNWTTALTIVAETDSIATCHRRLAERHAKLMNLQVLDPPFKPYRFSVSILRRSIPDDSIDWLVKQIQGAL